MAIATYCRTFRHLVSVLTLVIACAAEASPIACENVFATTITRPENTKYQLLWRDARTRDLQSHEIPDVASLKPELEQLQRSIFSKKSNSKTKLFFTDQTSAQANVERIPISNYVGRSNGSDVYSTTYYEKTTYRRGPLFIEKHEIKVHEGLPKQVLKELDKLSEEYGWDKGELRRRIFNDISNYGSVGEINNNHLWIAMDRANIAGKQLLDESLGDVLKFSLGQYERRNWTPDFIDQLIAKAFSALTKTDYVVVREATANNTPGKIVGSIGYTRSTYAQYRYFNKKTNRWEERLNDLDIRFLPSKSSPFSTKDLGYTTNLEVLPMEEFFGPHYELPRPGLVDYVHDGRSAIPPMVEDALRNYMHADTTKPFAIYTGQIFEPVKFAISKESGQRRVGYSAILLELFSSVFSSDRPAQFNAKAQRLYTYNTAEGVVMYKGMGFKDMGPEWSHVDAEGVQWFGLELTPQKLIETITNPVFMKGRVAEDFAKEFEASIARTLESQNQ
ncbi:hypothetical protein ACLVWU_11135 [Bdellovibrio sp. HCB290]|uniref:hypothetical protein n=1 Tax=Bdellovibrio sp. HCB290 TaxID=3394356 RepID=UPI0039B6D0F3